MSLPVKDYVWGIKVGMSDKALGTNPQVFSNPTLHHKDFPESFTRPGGKMYALENYLALAKVWKVLLEGYPGQDLLLGYALVGNDARSPSQSSIGGGRKLPPQDISSSRVQDQVDEVSLEEVQDEEA